MNIEHLVKMANQIEAFFHSEPDRATAIAAIENHLRRFWDPRMRRQIVTHLRAGGAGLGDLARAAVERCAADFPAQADPSASHGRQA
ncbi:MAG: formate dehydrogenase subunit delta [Gammaproteobacteria bacterium]